MTHEIHFDYHDGDIFWCTADVGWVTGHSYIVYGPLANGATTLMFEGVPTYPDAAASGQVCEKHKVNQFYTAPTAIRALMGQGTEFVEKYDLSSLKLLGTWASRSTPRPGTGTTTSWAGALPHRRHLVADRNRRPHDDPPARRARDQAGGSAMKPFFGVQPVVLDPPPGEEIHTATVEGVLCDQGQLARPDAHRLGRP
jgi:acetyl-CoA synthetase